MDSEVAKLGVGRHALQCLLCAVLLLGAMGCAMVEDSLYYKAVAIGDDGSQTVNYYRVDIEAEGLNARTFKVRSGYVSVDTIDTLSGDIPTIPEADFSPKEYAAFSQVKKDFRDRLTQQSGSWGAEDINDLDHFTTQAARVAWYASLSDKDFISIGQTEDVNPYSYRKLVFYTSAQDLNLTDYGTQVDNAIDKTAALAKHSREQREARKQEKQLEHQTKMNAVNKLVPYIFGAQNDADADAQKALIGLLLGVPVESNE